MGRPMGFEPTTSGTTNRRSNQLSYDRHTSALRRHIGTAEARFCRMSAIWEAESCGDLPALVIVSVAWSGSHKQKTPAEAIRRGSLFRAAA